MKKKLNLTVSEEVYKRAKEKGVRSSLFLENALRRELEMPEAVRPPFTEGQRKTIDGILEQKLSKLMKEEILPEIRNKVDDFLISKDLKERIKAVIKDYYRYG